MELVEVPQGRNPVQCKMHHETREIVKEKEDQRKAESGRPVAGTFKQPVGLFEGTGYWTAALSSVSYTHLTLPTILLV